MKNIIEKNFEMIDSESWKVYLIAILLISIPTMIHVILGKY